MIKQKVAVNLKRLIEILGQHLYSKPEICIRELIQNSHDSLLTRARKYPQIKRNTQIKIESDKANGTLSFIDTGIGMSSEEIEQRLAHIANSEKDKLREQFSMTTSEADSNLVIGSFGIGFLSSFLIAEHVTVKTRKAGNEGDAIIWTSVGDEFYETSPLTCSKEFFGTEVILKLKKPYLHFLNDEWVVKKIIKYCDFITYPIFFNDKDIPINMQMPPWRNSDAVDEDYLAYLQRRYKDVQYQAIIPLRWDGIVGGVIGIPDTQSKQREGICLHNDRIFINRTKDLLPRSLSFLVGTIDTTGLSLLLNREEYISDAKSTKLHLHLSLKVAEGLRDIAQNRKKSFSKIIKTWGRLLKWAAIESEAFFEQVGEYLQMSVCGEKLNMARIQERYRAAGEQTRFIYMDNESTQRQYSSMLTQFGLPVVETEDEIDFEFLNKYARKRKVKLEPADRSIISLIEPTENETWDRVIRDMFAFAESNNPGQIGAIQTAVFKMSEIPALISFRTDQHPGNQNLLRSKNLPEEIRKIVNNLEKSSRVLFLNIEHQLVLELKKLVADGPSISGTHIKAKIILMRGLLNAAAIHSGNYQPSALNQLLRDMTTALLFVAEQQNHINNLEQSNQTIE